MGKFPTDIEIAQRCEMQEIGEIAKKISLDEKYIERYGKYKAKINLEALGKGGKKGKLILVTAITPTAAGEGKTTTTIGLTDGLRRMGKNACAAIREPSLGPVFGVKGGATGGGYAQVVPMEDINLHFTGDFHAVSAANNLLAAMLDNHILQGNELNIDTKRITLKRCVDMNDRQLRFITDGLGGEKNGVPREDGFEITAASEIMAVLCLSESLSDLKKRLSEITVAYDVNGKAVKCGDLKAAGAMSALLKDAIKPNLVQSLEGAPVFVHGGPFANIAHGCNSVIATRFATDYGDYAITEAGFGADLGAEKFFDIKCRKAKLTPSVAVIVATVRALKMHGGADKSELGNENISALKSGIPNLLRHISAVKNVFNLPCVVALNRFPTDTDNEISFIKNECEKVGAEAVLSDVWAKGGEGGILLAQKVVSLCENSCAEFKFAYDDSDPVELKTEKIVKKVYGGAGVEFSEKALRKIKKLEETEYASMPVCIAKTQYSFSDDPKKNGAPEEFTVKVRDVKASTGAGFIVIYTGEILTMPGLPKKPAAENIDVSDDGTVSGIF